MFCLLKGVAELKMTCLLEDLIALGIPAETKVSGSRCRARVGLGRRSTGRQLRRKGILTFLRIAVVKDQPFAASRIFLPADMEHRLRRPTWPFHLLRTLEIKCGVVPARADQVIEAILAGAHQASLLDVTAGSALLSVTARRSTSAKRALSTASRYAAVTACDFPYRSANASRQPVTGSDGTVLAVTKARARYARDRPNRKSNHIVTFGNRGFPVC